MRDANLTWFGYIIMWDSEHTGRKMLEMKLGGRKKKRNFLDVVAEDMQLVGMTEEEAEVIV